MTPTAAAGGGAGAAPAGRVPRRGATKRGLAYGRGALAAGARGDRLFWALHRAALARGLVPVVPAAVVAEAVQAAGSGEALRRVLRGTEVEPLEGDRALSVGVLASTAGTDDVTMAAVVELACRRRLAVISERSSRLGALAGVLGFDMVHHVV